MAVKKPSAAKKSKHVTKKSKKSDSTDFSALDSAVSELAQQTAALLGDDTSPKPKLPKKKSAHKTNPKSFDVIHPKQAGAKTSVLKASAPTQTKLAEPEEKLLEAGDEKAKSDGKSAAETVDETHDSTDPKIVIGHNPGSLHVASKTPRVSSVQANKADEDPEEKPADPELDADADERPDEKGESIAVKRSKPQESESDEPEQNEPDVTDAVDKDEAKVSGDDKEPEAGRDDKDSTTPDNTKEDADEPAENGEALDRADDSSDPKQTAALGSHADASQGVQLFSDNLDDKKGGGDSQDGDDEKTDLFDTDEYHPKLHDWSKLEHHNNAPIIVLIVLLAVLAAGVYAVMTGMTLPFIGA